MTIIPLKRKPRPLRKTYDPASPYVVERHEEDGDPDSIYWEIWDYRPDSYRRVHRQGDAGGRDGWVKDQAEEIARGLNLLVQYGMEKRIIPPDNHAARVREYGEDDDE